MREENFIESHNDYIGNLQQLTVLLERKIKRTLLEEDTTSKTENPADIFIHILESWINKLKIRTTLDEVIDKQSFLDWREFCNTESLSFSGSFDFDTTVFDALKAVAFVGFAGIDFSFGKMRMIIKRRRTVISQHFHARNLRKFNYTRRQIEVPDLLKGEFINKDKFYLTDEIKFYLNDTDASTARDEETLTLFGVTDPAQAQRYLTLQKNQYEMLNEIWTFETDLQGIVARRGDLVGLNYYEQEESNFTARVHNILTEERPLENHFFETETFIIGVQIDQNSVPELLQDERYSCKIITDTNNNPEFIISEIKDTQVESEEDRIADDEEVLLQTREGKNIKARPKIYKTLMFETPVLASTAKVNTGNYVMFGRQNLVFRQCLVNSLSIDKNLSVSVSLTPYDERIFEY